MIELAQVSKVYSSGESRVEALRDVDLGIDRGEYISLIGPSGSGKSTLLHILGCLDRPTSGRYRLDGVDVGDLDLNGLADVRNRKVGFVFQRFHLMPRATAIENVMLPMRYAGVALKERRQRAEELMERVALGDRIEHRPSELSGGQQQRVAVARALANRPSLLLADEPTGNLDTKSGIEIVALLEELRKEGRTVIVVTHDESLAQRAHRTIRLLDGGVVSDA